MTELAATPAAAPAWSLPAATRIGHVHLKVADLDRAVGFYRDDYESGRDFAGR